MSARAPNKNTTYELDPALVGVCHEETGKRRYSRSVTADPSSSTARKMRSSAFGTPETVTLYMRAIAGAVPVVIPTKRCWEEALIA